MAIQTENVATNTNTANVAAGRNRKEADGFLNLIIVDKHGNEHKIKAVVALDKENRVHRALMANAENDLNLIGRVNLVDHNQEEIELL